MALPTLTASLGTCREPSGSSVRRRRQVAAVGSDGLPMARGVVVAEDGGGQFSPTADTRLVEDGLEVVLHRVGRQEQPAADLCGPDTLENEPQDVVLAPREPVRSRQKRDDVPRAGVLDGHDDVAPGRPGEGHRIVAGPRERRRITLDKSAGSFSPTTRYRDYAISRELIHWESQSATALDSPTGRRYVSQREAGTGVVLFARLSTADRAFWCLGPADYAAHQGERPIAITWRLRHRLPGDLYAQFAAAVA